MDQIISLDGSYLLPWHEITHYLANIFLNSNFMKGLVPLWFCYLESNMTVSLNHHLLNPLPSPSHSPFSVLPLFPSVPSVSNKPNNEWVATWDPLTRQIILGKTIEKFNNP